MRQKPAFALPTVLIVSVVLLMLLVTGISATVAISNGLRDQYYTKLASLASDAGTAFASACFDQNNKQVTWSDDKPLRPNTDCNGNIQAGVSGYVLNTADIRTYFTVGRSMESKGYTEAVRTSTGLAWRVWSTGTANAVQVPFDYLPVGSYLDGAWSTAPAGFLLADGSCVSTSTYGALYSALGGASSPFGADGANGCGGGTFKLPDMRGRQAIAKSASDTAVNNLGNKIGAVGETGGETQHTQTLAELVPHTHAFTDNGGTGVRATYGVSPMGGSGVDPAGSTTASAGSGQAFNVLDPYLVVTRVIKY